VGMLVLMVYTYAKVGGIVTGHQALTDLADLVPTRLTVIGHRGWTAMPQFGFGDTKYDLWWIVISTIVMGVGIGVLAQPQLVVRFMTVKSKRELNRAVGLGGFFILSMVGVAYMTGSLTNAYFSQHGSLIQGTVIKTINAEMNHVLLQVGDKTVPVVLDKSQPFVSEKIAQGRSISIVYAKGISDQIIPTYITTAMPKWFGVVFLLTLLAAAMSTLSSQFHTLGTAVGRDVFEQLIGTNRTIFIVRVAILLGLLLAVTIGYYAKKQQVMVSIIARATAIFFGLCAATFLPAFLGGLIWKRMTKAGAISSMIVGFLASATWLAFVKMPECQVIGLVKQSVLAGRPNWPVVDSLLIALPLSLLTAVVVSALTKPPEAAHVSRCFPTAKPLSKGVAT
jgi:solute:Na+ symporter, SSS family